MSSKRIEDLLQQCLEGYDGGMTPEECLSAFPAERPELEPLLRQALTLRMSFASAPSERFMARAKESLMFAAGRDVTAAMSVEPNPDFKMDARQRLIMAGGAAVQESLRDVPPPRLPFWVNARARMLEAAKNPQPRPKPVLTGAPALSMSLAGIVAAVAIAGGAFFFSQGSQPSVAAELAAIERQVLTIEQQQANGVFISPDLLADITRRTNDLAARIKAEDTTQVYVTLSLQPLIDRQWNLIQRNSSIKPPVGEPQDALQQIKDAQAQLIQAEEKIQVAAKQQSIAPPASQQQPSQAQQPSTSNQQAQPGSNPQQPSAQSQAAAQPTVPAFKPQQSNVPVGPVPAGQVRVIPLSNDRTANLNWVEIRTSDTKFVAPANWSIVGIVTDSNGIATLGGATSIGFASPDGAAIIFNTRTLNFDAVINGQAFPSFQRIDPVELAQRAGTGALLMRHMAESLGAP